MTFDVRHIRSIRYTNTMGADNKLEEDLRKAIEALGYAREGKSLPPGLKADPKEKTHTPDAPRRANKRRTP
jgi:hypothetical protein